MGASNTSENIRKQLTLRRVALPSTAENLRKTWNNRAIRFALKAPEHSVQSYRDFPWILGFVLWRAVLVGKVITNLHDYGRNGVLVIPNKSISNSEIPTLQDERESMLNLVDYVLAIDVILTPDDPLDCFLAGQSY